ncbi:MAG: ABC-type Mn2+/Zn2+ transport system permease subunit [Candidatus Omnitrophota bacterium]|jgi:ABC-type Mn2+/Zn2+ transport system permease subunit
MNDLIDLLSYQFNQRALLAALLIGVVNGYFSGYVVLRKTALFTGALSHSLLPGTAVGFILFGVSALSAFSGALIVSLIVGLCAIAISRGSRVDKDAALPILCTTAFAIGLLILDHIKINIELEGFLFGNILFLSDSDLWYAYAVGVFVMVMLVTLQRPLLLFIFEPNVAQAQGVPVRLLTYSLITLLIMTLITSLQAVGVILALGLLVSPGATVYLFVDSPRALFWGGALLGAVLTTSGVLLSLLLDERTGAIIVLLSGGVFLLCFFFSPKYGLLRQWLRARHAQH